MKIKKLFLAIALLAASMGGYAQKASYKKQGKPDAFGWYVVTEKKKFGFIDDAENIIVPIIYDKVEQFVGDFSLVQKGKMWGVVNRLGKEICPPVYEEIENFWMVSPDFAHVKRGGKWGFINAEGKEVIPPQYEKFVFDEGFAPLKGNGKIGFIDENCNIVVPAVYDDCTYFSHGSAAVKQNGRWGFVDGKGNVIVPITLNYDQVGVFNEGLIPVRQGKQWGYIDASDNVVIPINLKYDVAYNFSSGMARVLSGKKYGYIDKTGKIVIKPQYVAAADFIGEVAIVTKKNSTMLWMSLANSVAQSAAASAAYVQRQTFFIQQKTFGAYNDIHGFTDYQRMQKSQSAIQQQFQKDLQRAHAAAPKSGSGIVYLLGLIDKTGKELIPFKYGILHLEHLTGSWYIISRWFTPVTGEGPINWGGGPLVLHGIYDVEKKQEIWPAGDHPKSVDKEGGSVFDIATFADKQWIVFAFHLGADPSKKYPFMRQYGIFSYSGGKISNVIPPNNDIFDAIVFKPHERILVGDMLKRKGSIFFMEAGYTILEAAYGVIDYSGKVIIPKMVCEGIELIDNAFVATLKTGEKKYFDLDGMEIKR